MIIDQDYVKKNGHSDIRVADDFIGVHLAMLSSRVINVDDDNRSQMNGVQRNLMARS